MPTDSERLAMPWVWRMIDRVARLFGWEVYDAAPSEREREGDGK